MFIKRIVAVLSILAALAAAPAWAQQAVALDSDVKVVRVENGTERLETPANVVPGDRLVFTISYRNNDSQTVEDFVVTNPLPAAVALAEPGEFDVSVDAGKTFGKLAGQTVSENGASRPATLADVTHIRWVIASISAGGAGEIRYFATVR